MKSTFHFLLLACALTLPALAQAPADPFEAGMREAFTAYKKGDNEAVSKKLRELLKIIDSKGAARLAAMLPDALGTWTADAVKAEEAGSVVTQSRTYVSGDKKVVISVTKDSPVVGELLSIFVNEELLKLANRSVHKISGQTGVMEGENKLQVIVDERIYVELLSEAGAKEPDLVELAGKLDLQGMAQIK